MKRHLSPPSRALPRQQVNTLLPPTGLAVPLGHVRSSVTRVSSFGNLFFFFFNQMTLYFDKSDQRRWLDTGDGLSARHLPKVMTNLCSWHNTGPKRKVHTKTPYLDCLANPTRREQTQGWSSCLSLITMKIFGMRGRFCSQEWAQSRKKRGVNFPTVQLASISQMNS